MASVVLIGTDVAVLEGLAQTLAAAGHRPRIAAGFPEAAEGIPGELPLVAVVERQVALDAEGARLPLLAGGAIILFHEQSRIDDPHLPHWVQRMTLADLTLPLERQRLVALVQHVEERALQSGRGRRPSPPPEPRPS